MSNTKNLRASEDLLAPVYKFYFNGEYREALSVLDVITQDFPNDPILFSLGGDCYVSLKQYELAIQCYEEALKLSPKNIKFMSKKIEVLCLCGKIEESLELCYEAIMIAPDDSNLYLFQGNIFQELGRPEESIDSYNKVIKLNPNSADAYCNMSNSLENLGKFDEAIIYAKKAIQIKPDFSLAFFNLGVAAMQTRSFDLSMKSFNKAIELQPNLAKYEHAKATLLLLFGDFKNGWNLWESRWNLDRLFSPKLDTNCPVWAGDKNSKLLVWAEQGVGDQIMYGGLIPDLSEICPDISVQVDPRIVNLFNRSMGDKCTFYPDNKSLPVKYDQHISMGSLCKHLRTDEKDFESSRYGFLKDDKDVTADIKKDLAALVPKNTKLCGISWRSGNLKFGKRKTIKLKNLINSLDLKGYTFINLQYGNTKDEAKEVKDELNIDVVSYDKVDNFNNLDGLTSLIQCCDIVISVDNITCQLAGALGKETHMLLPYGSNWMWMVERNDSPWYDSIKIYRQGADNDWLSLFKRLKNNLD